MTAAKMASTRTRTHHHRRKCRDHEADQFGCLHGTCYYSPFRGYFCSCQDGWTGGRCAMQKSAEWFKPWETTSGSVSATVVAVTSVSFLVMFVVIVFIIYNRRHRGGTRQNRSVNEQRTGNVHESLEQELAPSDNNNNVMISLGPASSEQMLNASQTPEVTSYSSHHGDDVTGRTSHWEPLCGVRGCATVVAIRENTGEVGIDIL